MNDITALMATMKAAAENLDGDTWHDEGASVYGGAYDVGDTVCYDHIVDCENVNGESLVAEFIAIANPASVLALVEALEKAQRSNEYLREQSAEWERKAISNFEECVEMSARIEELESEVKFPGVMHCNSCGFSRSHVIVTPGGMRAGESTPEHCPNGCGPMWHDTYRRQYNELYDAYKALESHTVTVKLPKLYGIDFCDRIVPDSGNGFLFYSEQVVEILAAAGIQVIEGEG